MTVIHAEEVADIPLHASSLRVRPSQEGMQRALLFPYEARFGFENSMS
jgi:hypothetical protein